MPSSLSTLFVLAFSCAVVDAAALVPVATFQPSLPVADLEPNRGQAKAGILFLVPGGAGIGVTAQSVLYSPLGVTLSLVASNPNPTVSFTDPLPGLVNSYTGSNSQNWVTGIPRYAAANLARIYPGIDAQYTVANNGVLTLNLLLAAGVSPNAITFEVAPANAITVNPDGSLLVKVGYPSSLVSGAPYPSMSYTVPVAVQEIGSGQVSRGVSFAVKSTTQFGLAVQGIDATLPLQISMPLNSAFVTQPFLVHGTSEHASDTTGNTFFTTQIADAAGKDAPFPAIGGEGCGVVLTVLASPCSDVAIYKFSAAGVLEFITYLAGRTNESAGFLGLAPDGTLLVAGATDSSDFPVTAGALQPAYAGPPAAPGSGDNTTVFGDYFAARLDSSTGKLLNSTYLGGPNADRMAGAALGADGSLYFLPASAPNSSFSNGMPVTNGALQASCQGNPCQNGYVARLAPALDKLVYGTYVPGIAQATAQVYSDGSVYYAGAAGPGFPTTPSAYQPQNAGGYDGIVARLDPTGSRLLFATYVGGPDTD